jgi:Bacterial PH domain
MSNNEIITYPTAISWWLWIPIYTLIIGQGIFLMEQTNVWFFLFHLTLAILIYLFIVRIQYIITADQIIIKMGPFSYRKIDIATIRKMELSNNPLSAPAASLQRIAIHYNKGGYILVSPKNRAEFIDEVEKRKQALSSEPT